MSWNNGYEKAKFEAEQRRLAKEYRAAGMNEEQIQQMRLHDLEVLKSDRKFCEHTQQLAESDFEYEDEGNSPLNERFQEVLAVNIDQSEGHSRYWWIEEIENPQLAQLVRQLSRDDLELITMLAFEGRIQKEIASAFSITQPAVTLRIQILKKKIKNFLKSAYKKRLLGGYQVRG